ncbi:winged helix-turn-helix transcriptional regulator [Nocardia sp. NPDC101769]|uniref:winged helix-turn-helix transcriptional regulator n=1 Tax=Nocardia sp. NPDC101769 TaxID=3364333 RepID=UPI0037FE217F
MREVVQGERGRAEEGEEIEGHRFAPGLTEPDDGAAGNRAGQGRGEGAVADRFQDDVEFSCTGSDLMVERRMYPTVPVTVEYDPTPLGRSLAGAMAAPRAWAYGHIGEIDAARTEYDRRDAPGS